MANKKLLVFSDSHGSLSALKALFNWAKERHSPNGTIIASAFLGDGFSDLQKAAEATGFLSDWKIVCGNNDYTHHIQEAAVFDLADHRFFMCHGHRQSIYRGYHLLLSAAKNNGADVALFGHSHVPFYENIDGISLINPGSVARPRSKTGATFAVIECPEGEPVIVEFFGVDDNGVIKKINFPNS